MTMLSRTKGGATTAEAGGDVKISELPLLDEMLFEWNKNSRDYPADVCLHELIEAQVERTPDAIALVFEDESLSYRELNRRANRLAYRLREVGVGPEVIVGIFAERSLAMIVGLLATLKAGGAYLPLDLDYPLERLAFMLGDAKPLLVLTQRDRQTAFPPHTAGIICLDEDFDAANEANLASGVRAENLAYVLYTSGSTGQPKGVMITHRAICNRSLWVQEKFHLTSDDCMMLKAPLTYDVSVSEIFWPLSAGARLLLARPGLQGDSRYLIETVCKNTVTTLNFAPAMLAALLEDKEVGRCLSLRRVFSGGERLPFDLPERFFAALPHAELHNAYGPTETTIDVTYWKCKPGTRDSNPPIGLPHANTQTYVLDRAMQPVPAGDAGELHIGGVQLARGYLGRPELTAEKFVPNPFDEGRLYKTGDLARYRSDGAIEYLGRIDSQVKLRGFRIELGEVEAVLNAHPAVRDCVALLRETGSSSRLVGYIVASGVTSPDLRQYAKKSLPDFMVPSAFVFLEKLPLMANGKLDRRALPEPEQRSQPFVEPRTPLEQKVAKIWEDALGIDSVGAHDNFFELGGHSLSALGVANQLRDLAGGQVSLGLVLRAPTVAQLAELLEQKYFGKTASKLTIATKQGNDRKIMKLPR